ncbi:hypothetical protein [Bacillus cereus]|uniref:hypothetical protein n=1 Tax=Bacillus cereus TaxID=1396 RepID=UPI000279E3BC|nr:hypothetical protein [Bacillus cereus]EJS02222.1 hypothetical protein IKG_01126 [Bacillus cereus VD200]
MEIKSRITDFRIKAENIFIEMSYEEYLEIAEGIIENNPLQRKRVKSSNTVYSLLRSDLKSGCLMPPMVLALSNGRDIEYSNLDNDQIINYILGNKDKLIILDGLQRTHTLKDVKLEYINYGDYTGLENYYGNKLRIELYLGISKFGILYRMLTLNTGQTPMSIRHQIEMLYKDYMVNDIEGITLLSEVDESGDSVVGTYSFKSMIEGFNSYLERDPLPMDRFDILNNIKGLEKLSQEDQEYDIFKEFLLTYNHFINKMIEISEDWHLEPDYEKELELSSRAFGNSALKIFNKSQAITAFGAALGKLKDFGLINNFNDIKEALSKVEFEGETEDWMIDLITNMDRIKQTSKKIGNSQRVYFYWFFRELFNSESDSYLNLNEAVSNGFNKYRSQTE